MPERDLVRTGITGLDVILSEGIPRGNVILVEGAVGTGKTTLGVEFGERSVMFTLDEQVEQIKRNAKSIGIDLQPWIDQGLVRLQYDPPQEILVDEHFHGIEQVVEEFKPKRVVFDSISTYGSSLGTHGRVFRDFFHALVALMKEHQTATVYNHENPEMLGMSSMMGDFAMSSLLDSIILMNWVELGDEFRLGLTVAKMRGNPTTRITHECEILDGQGMRVLSSRLRVSKARLAFFNYDGLISRAPTRQLMRPGVDTEE